MMVMAVIMSVGLGVYGYVDSQGKASATERIRESSLNLAESALNEELFLVSRNWPGPNQLGGAQISYPNCSSSAWSPAMAQQCPDPSAVARSFTTPDYAQGTSWSATVRDDSNASLNFYDDAVTQAGLAYDSNNNGRLWLRASATVRGQTRTVIALVQVEQTDDSSVFPHNVITAGRFATSNNGNKVIVNTQGTAASPSPLAVRCDRSSPGCLSYDAAEGQVAPDTTAPNYAGGNALSPQRLDELRARAKANGLYYASCPAALPNGLVFVESGNCSFGANAQYNAPPGPPGVLVIANGSLTLGGTSNFYGVIYVANPTNSSGTLVTTTGDASIQGSIAIDGNGGMLAGSSKLNVIYDLNAFSALSGYGNAGVVQNTWRELIAK